MDLPQEKAPIMERADRHNVDQRVAKIECTLQQYANVGVRTAESLIAIERRVDRLEQASALRHQ
jgi:hypothetical protein